MNDPAVPNADRLSLSAERRIDEVCISLRESLCKPASPSRSKSILKPLRSPSGPRCFVSCCPSKSTTGAAAANSRPWTNTVPVSRRTPSRWQSGIRPSLRSDVPRPAEATPKLRTIPGYEIVAELGRGGMGVVYQAAAHQVSACRGSQDDSRRRTCRRRTNDAFLGEARAVASLQHANIVQLYDISEHDGLPYFSLEYVDGGNLAARLKGSPPSDMEAARLVELLAPRSTMPMGDSVVHRDLKPANILLTSDGVPKIADFGLAKILSEDSGATRTGAILGTPSYMAPEQASGKAKDIGPAVDIYAWARSFTSC